MPLQSVRVDKNSSNFLDPNKVDFKKMQNECLYLGNDPQIKNKLCRTFAKSRPSLQNMTSGEVSALEADYEDQVPSGRFLKILHQRTKSASANRPKTLRANSSTL